MKKVCRDCGKYSKTYGAFTHHLNQCPVKLGKAKRRISQPEINYNSHNEDFGEEGSSYHLAFADVSLTAL